MAKANIAIAAPRSTFTYRFCDANRFGVEGRKDELLRAGFITAATPLPNGPTGCRQWLAAGGPEKITATRDGRFRVRLSSQEGAKRDASFQRFLTMCLRA